MLATNILLSGNNFAKVALLFKFMNLGMVSWVQFERIQALYVVPTIMGEIEDGYCPAVAGHLSAGHWRIQTCFYELLLPSAKIGSGQQTDESFLVVLFCVMEVLAV